jgi:hypothetical protein
VSGKGKTEINNDDEYDVCGELFFIGETREEERKCSVGFVPKKVGSDRR